MKNLKIALDWTANINHIGFYVALQKKFYNEERLDVEIISPEMDDYQTTPAKKLELGEVDFALCPTESLISYRTKQKPFPIVGIASLLQEDLSAIVVKKKHGIESPKDLDNKIYASYKARYEDEIVKQMLINDGGMGNIELSYPPKLEIWNKILNNEAHATWIFMNWEGVKAKNSDTEFNFFYLKDYDIPYSYSPVIATNSDKIKTHREAYVTFLSATKKGYLFAQKNPEEALAILKEFLPEEDKDIPLKKVLEISSEKFGNDSSWGKFNENIVSQFLDWLHQKGLEKSKLKAEDIVTNTLL